MPRQTELERHWEDLMALCQREKEWTSGKRHPKLLRFVTQQIDELAAELGFSRAQIKSREFRAEKDGERISRLLTE